MVRGVGVGAAFEIVSQKDHGGYYSNMVSTNKQLFDKFKFRCIIRSTSRIVEYSIHYLKFSIIYAIITLHRIQMFRKRCKQAHFLSDRSSRILTGTNYMRFSSTVVPESHCSFLIEVATALNCKRRLCRSSQPLTLPLYLTGIFHSYGRAFSHSLHADSRKCVLTTLPLLPMSMY